MLNWLSTGTLGSIETGEISEFSVTAIQTHPISEIKYKLASGVLPTGLQVKNDGTITGRVGYSSTGTFTFGIAAQDIANTEISTSTFSITVTKSNELTYTEVYFKPFLSLAKRSEFRRFINNDSIFLPALMYRNQDVNFGVQRNMKMVLEFGLEQIDLAEYYYALQENFYRKRIRLGEVKSAIAKDAAGNHVYDVIYVEVVDELVNSAGVSAESVVHLPYIDELYYPGSIFNMRKQLKSITLLNWTTIGVKNNLQPRFMRTQQNEDFRSETYMSVVPLCYTLPGKSKLIMSNINASGFKFNTVDFEIDRLVVENSADNNAAKYLIFSRQAVGDLLDIDEYILGPEGWIRLDDENDQPLERE
jgi:hypothetical protein